MEYKQKVFNKVLQIIENYTEENPSLHDFELLKNAIFQLATYFNIPGLPWFLSGGTSIDLYLNKITRKHDDIELALYRSDLEKWYKYFDSTKHTLTRDGNSIDFKDSVNFNTLWLLNPAQSQPLDNIEIMLLNNSGNSVAFYNDPNFIFTEYKDPPIVEVGIERAYLTPPIVTLMHKIGNGRLKDFQDIQHIITTLDKSSRNNLYKYAEEVYKTFILTENDKSIGFEELLRQKFDLKQVKLLLTENKELQEKLKKVVDDINDGKDKIENLNHLIEQRIKSVRLWHAIYNHPVKR